MAARLAQSAGGNSGNEEVRLPEQIFKLLSDDEDLLDDIQAETNTKITVSRDAGMFNSTNIFITQI